MDQNIVNLLKADVSLWKEKMIAVKKYNLNKSWNKKWNKTPRKLKKKYGNIVNTYHLKSLQNNKDILSFYMIQFLYLQSSKMLNDYMEGKMSEFYIGYLKTKI